MHASCIFSFGLIIILYQTNFILLGRRW